MRPRARLLACTLGACLPLSAIVPPVPAYAAAPTEDSEARAMRIYNEGQDAYDAGDYETALQRFLEAQSLYPSPVFHYNIALCHESLENYEQAIISYQAYLNSYESAFGEPPEDTRSTEDKIERLEAQIEARNAREEAERAKASKPKVIVQQVEVEAERPPGRPLIITGAVLTGVGVLAAGVGGGVFGMRASNFGAQMNAVYEEGNPERVTLAEARELDASGRSAQLGQILSLSVGGAMAITGVALLAVGLGQKKRGNNEKTPSVTPTAGPEGAGLLIRGRF
ncbi:hypothetical protein G6O69_15270 [Pseudenhygromyxa sp. WMMC2535]|uniref:tetratricopeptide repeat protein n=1 Tax=Pseudenhygromyxa sp. WMMC2535 TaxID=2712867 RepID=UPI001595D0DD|nr:tetratricopeptide repeat protein [Pseudenhygromyxa sp. WMMC2535]NVB39202.1 hypothetical protein [Pseudenhygromyxa sp. WMMC2535]